MASSDMEPGHMGCDSRPSSIHLIHDQRCFYPLQRLAGGVSAFHDSTSEPNLTGVTFIGMDLFGDRGTSACGTGGGSFWTFEGGVLSGGAESGHLEAVGDYGMAARKDFGGRSY